MTWKHRIPVVALAGAVLLWCGSSCGGDAPLRILAPQKNSTFTWMPVSVSIDMEPAANPATLVVKLNGNDVTALFTIDDPPSGRTVATASALWEGMVLPGSNQIVARVSTGGKVVTRERTFETEGDAYADSVLSFSAGSSAGYGEQSWVLGPPVDTGVFQGSLDVLSLGLDGTIEVEFTDNVIVDGAGPDFTVFENPFLEIGIDLFTDPPFSEPGEVSVSQDGVTWFAFPCALDPGLGPYFPGCAGVYPSISDANDPATPHASIPTSTPIEELVDQDFFAFPMPEGSGGDSFDLADVGLAWARFVRIQSADFNTGVTGPNNAGFDLDAVSAVNSAPATDEDGNGIPDAVE